MVNMLAFALSLLPFSEGRAEFEKEEPEVVGLKDKDKEHYAQVEIERHKDKIKEQEGG